MARSRKVALVTCVELPEPDLDEPLYVPALEAEGLQARVVAWDDPSVDFGAFDACVLRSTWNYYRDLGRFLRWVGDVADATRLYNPAPVVEWNAHKAYLLDLAAHGIPVVPTVLVPKGERRTLASAADELGADEIVVKPAVSAGSYRTERGDPRGPDAERLDAHFDGLVRDADVLVQPYLRAVESVGERAIVCIDGEVSHCVRKSPRFGTDAESVSGALPIAADEHDFATRILSRTPALEGTPLYARVDVVRTAEGLRLMELELIEPSLFFGAAPAALTHFAKAIAKRLR